MTLLVVVIALVAPSLGNFFRGRDLDSESTRFLALARYARSRAVSEGVPMLLWLDPVRRAYGLTEEYGFSARDEKAVTFQLAEDVELQLDPRERVTGPQAPVPPGTPGPGAGAVSIRFQPDGFVGGSSPQSFHLRERERTGGPAGAPRTRSSVWITQSQNRASYEVQTNDVAFVRR